MKLLTTLLIAVLAALMVYTIRRRIWLALRVGGAVYVIVLFGRLLLSSSTSLADRWEDFVWPVFGILVVWAVLWFVSTAYERRKAARERG